MCRSTLQESVTHRFHRSHLSIIFDSRDIFVWDLSIINVTKITLQKHSFVKENDFFLIDYNFYQSIIEALFFWVIPTKIGVTSRENKVK